MDCQTEPAELIDRCLEMKINCLAIADHGTIAGGQHLQKIAPFSIIVAEEILTTDGEIMGMFLGEEIPNNLPAFETVHLIKEQDGIVCIPHPFDPMRSSAIKNMKLLEQLMPFIDVIEAFNARSIFDSSQKKAIQLASRFNKTVSAGSDAHSAAEIGRFCMEMPDFTGRDEFLHALSQGKLCGQKSSFWVHFRSTLNKLKKN